MVSITLLCSWILALTMTPLLCVKFLRVKPPAGKEEFAVPGLPVRGVA